MTKVSIKEYTDEHSRSGLEIALPEIATWPNQFNNYEITITVPEYTSVCPKTNLPDFGTLTIKYIPNASCLELKSLKYYLLAYRSLGIFYENAVNRILDDIVKSCQPLSCVVKGEFNTRGGMYSTIEARYPRNKTTV